jgi:hypothetical protein
MPGNGLRFYGTVGKPGAVGAQPDPSQWLGYNRSTTPVHALQSTFTAATTPRSRHVVVDSARIGDGDDAHAFRWLLVQTGAAALSAARVMRFESATGKLLLDRPVSAEIAPGDAYALFAPGNVFPNVTAQQSAEGETRYRCIYLRNEHGASIANVGFYLVPLSLGGDAFEHVDQKSTTAPFMAVADELTSPFNAVGGRQDEANNSFQYAGGFVRCFDYSRAVKTASLASNQGFGIYLRRTIDPGQRYRRSVALLLVVGTSTTGSDPSPLFGACILAYDIAGYTPSLSAQADRYVHLAGGARVEARVTAQETGLAVEDRPVRFEAVGGGTLYTRDEPSSGYALTEASGEASAAFHAPTSPALEGQNVTLKAIVGAGLEVANPGGS